MRKLNKITKKNLITINLIANINLLKSISLPKRFLNLIPDRKHLYKKIHTIKKNNESDILSRKLVVGLVKY